MGSLTSYLHLSNVVLPAKRTDPHLAWFQTSEPQTSKIYSESQQGLMLCTLAAPSQVGQKIQAIQNFVGQIKKRDVIFLCQKWKNWRWDEMNGAVQVVFS